jgi:hypothetical protein
MCLRQQPDAAYGNQGTIFVFTERSEEMSFHLLCLFVYSMWIKLGQ